MSDNGSDIGHLALPQAWDTPSFRLTYRSLYQDILNYVSNIFEIQHPESILRSQYVGDIAYVHAGIQQRELFIEEASRNHFRQKMNALAEQLMRMLERERVDASRDRVASSKIIMLKDLVPSGSSFDLPKLDHRKRNINRIVELMAERHRIRTDRARQMVDQALDGKGDAQLAELLRRIDMGPLFHGELIMLTVFLLEEVEKGLLDSNSKDAFYDRYYQCSASRGVSQNDAALLAHRMVLAFSGLASLFSLDRQRVDLLHEETNLRREMHLDEAPQVFVPRAAAFDPSQILQQQAPHSGNMPVVQETQKVDSCGQSLRGDTNDLRHEKEHRHPTNRPTHGLPFSPKPF